MKTLVALGVTLLLVGCPTKEEIDKEAKKIEVDIHQKVVDDSVQQYEIVKRNGDKMEACVHAGMVAAAQLQAKNETEYKRWKDVEKKDCKRAGM